MYVHLDKLWRWRRRAADNGKRHVDVRKIKTHKCISGNVAQCETLSLSLYRDQKWQWKRTYKCNQRSFSAFHHFRWILIFGTKGCVCTCVRGHSDDNMFTRMVVVTVAKSIDQILVHEILIIIIFPFSHPINCAVRIWIDGEIGIIQL